MIKFKINNKKTKVWYYERLIENMKPIIVIVAWFAMYALVSHMEFGYMLAE